MPKVGAVVGNKYRIVRRIGTGGMGAVFEATNEELSKRVAIKIPSRDIRKVPTDLARFKQEPRLAAATGHQGIVEIYDVGELKNGLPYVVMELLEGESLTAKLERDGRCEPAFAAYVIAQILSALAAAHDKSIIHRDLKPDNIFLVESDDDVPRVKLVDFGSSKAISGSQAGRNLTESGSIVGTPYYMSPEQFTDEKDADHRIDIYAVGVVLYQTLTGQRPIEAINVYALVQKMLNGEIEPPSSLCPDIPPELEEVVLRAMAREKEERYSSAASMLQAVLPHVEETARARIPLPEELRHSASEPGEDHIAAESSGRDSSPPPDDMEETDSPHEESDDSAEDGDDSAKLTLPDVQSRNRWLVIAFVLLVGILIGVIIWSSGRFEAGEDSPPPTEETGHPTQ